MSNYVPGEGPSDAKIALVGEAPGAEEERLGRPFVGPTGKIIDQLLKECGLDRREVYITNVVKLRPPANNIRLLGELGKSIDDFLPQLFSELNSIKPNVVVGFGNTALSALTGNRGIEKWRGSILQTLQGHKFIPTIHPASLLHAEADGKMRSWRDLVFIRWDIERAIRESKTKAINLPPRDLRVATNSLDVFRFFDDHSSSKRVAVDIETYKTIPLCIAFAFDSYSAISIPLFDIPGPRPIKLGQTEKAHIWKAVSEILYDPKIMKIGQNFKFDQGQLEHCINGTFPTKLNIRGFFFDTMLAFKTLYPELPNSLQFICSVLTDEPFYKDEGREYNPAKDDPKRLLLYNAKDAVVTYECYQRELEELRERKLDEFFFTKVMPLHQLYYDIEHRGILRDDSIKAKLEKKYRERQEELSDARFVMIGKEINVNSPKQVSQLIYNDLNMPKRMKGTSEIALDALLRNTAKNKEKQRIIENILEERKVRKTIGTYINAKTHPDRRIHTGCRIMLETGRTSTSVLKPPVTTESLGMALQTLEKHGDMGEDLRSMFIPSPGYVFIEPDLSQAEARVVALLARDERLQKFFEYGIDIHSTTASWISINSPDAELEEFYGAEEERSRQLAELINRILKSRISESDRQLGKKFRHAGHYNMGAAMASLQAGIPEAKAKVILDKFHSTNPNIKQVFHAEIQSALKENNRVLTNPFGRQRIFMNKWGEELFKEAYSQIPQSTVSDQTKFAMLRLSTRVPGLRILLESHDSFLVEVKIADVDKLIPIIKEELEQPIDFSKCTLPRGELIIPCEVKIGKNNWRDMEKVL